MKHEPSLEVDQLAGLTLHALREAWRVQFREQPPALSRGLLARAFAYRVETIRHGGMKPSLKRRLTDLAARFAAKPDFDPAPRRAPPVGSALVRDWNGVRHVVMVNSDGFQYLDRTYRSLSQVAKEISGQHQSGPKFFGLVGKAEEPIRA